MSLFEALKLYLCFYFSYLCKSQILIHGRAKQDQWRKPISSLMSLLWPLYAKAILSIIHKAACISPSHHHRPTDTHKSSQVFKRRCSDRGQKEENWRRKKLELPTNSIDGERSQFGFSAEGRLLQFPGSVAAISILSLSWGYEKGDMGLRRKIKTSLAARADGCERNSKWP